MKQIQVLGTGCAKCHNLIAYARQAVQELGLDVAVEPVQDITAILSFEGVQALPALAVDGQVRVCGRVPNVQEIKTLLAP